MRASRFPAAALAAILAARCAGLAVDPDRGGVLDLETVTAGLREALVIGSGRAVDRTAAVDGYLANELIRIAVPPELDSMASTLRRLGLGRQVDELEVAMNRAAERAAGEAREVLVQEIRELSLAEARAILAGGPTAATDHFRAEAGAELERRFRPIAAAHMDEVGVTRIYGELADAYNRLPFVRRPAIELDDYVTAEALDGLFTVLGEEEGKIRRDPVARTTELLRRVFGRVV